MQKMISGICLLVSIVTNAQTPELVWAKSIGGFAGVDGYSIAADMSGNVYTTGAFNSTADFDPGKGIFNLKAQGDDLFVSKLDSSGNFIWAKSMGGSFGSAYGQSIALDGSGNIFITGYYIGTIDFDPGPGIYNLTPNGGEDIFILKLNESGNIVWAKSIGGDSYEDAGKSICLDQLGNIFVTGRFYGTVDFNPGANIFNLISSGDNDIFILKLDASGNFVWAKNIGGYKTDYGNSIVTDITGNVYTTGFFSEVVDFDPDSLKKFILISAGATDIFISKLDASGNFVWAKQFGGTEYDFGNSITKDNTGNIYTTGGFQGKADFDPDSLGKFNLTTQGSTDIFISKIDSSGNFIWAKSLGAVCSDAGNSIFVDILLNVYTTGYFYGNGDFNPDMNEVYHLIPFDYDDIFISKLDMKGNFIWAIGMGEKSNDVGRGIVLNVSGNIFTVGTYEGQVDFDPGSTIFNLTSVYQSDMFVHKMIQKNDLINNTYSDIYSIYPNPTNGIFNIAYSTLTNNISIEIYNSLGALVYKKADNNTIDISSQADGLYIVKVLDGNSTVATRKIMKQ